MKRFNINELTFQYDEDDPADYRAGFVRIAPAIGAATIGATIYELPPGQSNCPYHYEYGNEEWLLVLEGTLTLRHPGGEDELRPGDVVCFPIGPDGAHKLTNRSDTTVRAMVLSTKFEPAVAVYPDSDKIGVWPGRDEDRIMVRRDSNVDYWDRELSE
ncbi:MAG TPA: cupin domain-containing protein [Gaiellaceae bacterium]|jgi:uncharacterized cupin superfamily protein|nr:cupin domain-containing protein [Gaiellaceae bacterium]